MIDALIDLAIFVGIVAFGLLAVGIAAAPLFTRRNRNR